MVTKEIANLIDAEYEGIRKYVALQKKKWEKIGRDKRILIWGTGECGKALYWRCKNMGVNVTGFADNNEKIWDKIVIDGVKCLSKQNAFHEKTVFLIGIGDLESRNIVKEMLKKEDNAEVYVTVYDGYQLQSRLWGWSDAWLSVELEEVKKSLKECVEALEDEQSKVVLLSKVKFLLGKNVDFSEIYTPHQYFIEKGKFLEEGEVIADGGAYDGDTLKGLVEEIGYRRFEKYVCFEMDEANCRNLRQNIKTYHKDIRDKVFVEEVGIGEESSEITYSKNKTNSRIGEAVAGDAEGRIISLDDYFKNEKVTFIKMDIEGYEKKAIHGAQKVIRQHKPKLAIAIYHKVEDIWEIQKYLMSLVPEYKFIIRHHSKDETETILYAQIGGFADK